MDFKNLTPKNKNALLIGGAILIAVITMLAGFLTSRSSKPSGANLQGSLPFQFQAPATIPDVCTGTPNPAFLKKNANGVLEASIQWKTNLKGNYVYVWTWDGKEKQTPTPDWTVVYTDPGIKKMQVTVYMDEAATKTLSCEVEVKPEVKIKIETQEKTPLGNVNFNTPDNTDPIEIETTDTEEDTPPEEETDTTGEVTGDTQDETGDLPVEDEENLFVDTPEEEVETTTTDELKPVQDILSCKLSAPTLALSKPEKVLLHCDVKPDAIVSAFLVKGSFDPSKTPSSDQIVKILLSEKNYTSGTVATPVHFILPFDGKDKFDGLVDPGDYTFVVLAAPDSSYEPDYSILKLKVVAEAPLTVLETKPEQTETESGEVELEKPAKPQTVNKDEVVAPPKPVEMSKCQTPYPSDIEGHWAEGLIREAYDRCVMKGFPDGTARPNQSVTRAEAVALALKTVGIPPKTCYDNDCGTSFLDIRDWQSGFIREAFDRKIVKGYSSSSFGPNKSMTRAEASSLTVRLFRLPIPKKCSDPHCGAGYQENNIFYDIQAFWQGYYIRALSDLGVVQGTYPHRFEPDRFITRAELLKILLKVQAAKQ